MKNSEMEQTLKLARRFYRALTYKNRRLMRMAGVKEQPASKQPRKSEEK